MQLFDNLRPFDFNIFNPVDWFDLAERYGLEQWVVAHRWVAGVGALVSLLFIGFASGVLMMMLANWGFRLTREPRALRRTRGLTTRTDVEIGRAHVELQSLMRISYAVFCFKQKKIEYSPLRLYGMIYKL